MPDMQTEVRKILNNWSFPEESPTQTSAKVETKSFSEKLYEYIKDHPKCSMKQIREAFGIKNKDDASIASTLKTLYDRKLIGRVVVPNPDFKGGISGGRRMIFIYWAVASTYTTQIKGLYSKKNKVVKIVAKKNKATPAAAVPHASNPEPKSKPATKFNAEEFVNGLNVYDARHVWQLLNIVFGKQAS